MSFLEGTISQWNAITDKIVCAGKIYSFQYHELTLKEWTLQAWLNPRKYLKIQLDKYNEVGTHLKQFLWLQWVWCKHKAMVIVPHPLGSCVVVC